MTIHPKHRSGFTFTDVLVALTIVMSIVTMLGPASEQYPPERQDHHV